MGFWKPRVFDSDSLRTRRCRPRSHTYLRTIPITGPWLVCRRSRRSLGSCLLCCRRMTERVTQYLGRLGNLSAEAPPLAEYCARRGPGRACENRSLCCRRAEFHGSRRGVHILSLRGHAPTPGQEVPENRYTEKASRLTFSAALCDRCDGGLARMWSWYSVRESAIFSWICTP